MEIPPEFFREELQERRAKLSTAVHTSRDPNLARLLDEVDEALGRVQTGTFGLCEVCHEPIEADRLLADPLTSACLDHLSAKEQQALERDLALAGQVQRNLLPPRLVEVNGWSVSYHYQPLSYAGGDYCDIVPKGDSLYFLLGDVSGKGVAASMLASNLHGLFRTILQEQPSVSDAMLRANRIFCESTMSSHYATIVCAQTRSDGLIEIANGGHCAPYLVKEDGEVTPLDSTSLPLGVFCETSYAKTCVSLMPGESLFLYTDGLSECRNPQGEEYGASRLVEFLRTNHPNGSGDLLRSCLEDAQRFRQQQPLSDDLTIMLVRRS